MLAEKQDQFLVLESIPNKVWNPVFTAGVITFVLSMLFRGFFNSELAVFPLALSTLILFSGVWILSANGKIVLDNNESKCYFIYKHLGYFQKIYTYPLTSFDKVLLTAKGNQKFLLGLLSDNGKNVTVAYSKNKEHLLLTGREMSSFLKIPLQLD